MFFLFSLASSAAPQARVGSAMMPGGSQHQGGHSTRQGVTGPAGPWEPSFPGACKTPAMTVASPASIFSDGVASWWCGMLPARLLPTSLLLALLTKSLLTASTCFEFFPPIALFHDCQAPCLSFPIHTCPGEGLLQTGVGDGVSGEVCSPRLLHRVGRICSPLPGDHLGAHRTSSSTPKSGIFCTSPEAPSVLQPHLVPCSQHCEGGIPVPHTSATPTGTACQPLPSCANLSEAFASPASVASRSDWQGCRQQSPMAHLTPQQQCPSWHVPWWHPELLKVRTCHGPRRVAPARGGDPGWAGWGSAGGSFPNHCPSRLSLAAL